MKPVVVDASLAGAWVLPDERTPGAFKLYADACVTSDQFFAPQLLVIELGNLLVSSVRSQRISPENLEDAQAAFDAALIVFDPLPNLHTRSQISRLALQHKLTFYDACYLELVLRLNGQLASKDKDLVKAAKSCGIVCLDF